MGEPTEKGRFYVSAFDFEAYERHKNEEFKKKQTKRNMRKRLEYQKRQEELKLQEEEGIATIKGSNQEEEESDFEGVDENDAIYDGERDRARTPRNSRSMPRQVGHISPLLSFIVF